MTKQPEWPCGLDQSWIQENTACENMLYYNTQYQMSGDIVINVINAYPEIVHDTIFL